ncbi:hypothetical protein CVT26_008491 [Gymnopilus dilepis]|uniref:Uncharacterized protein n=1 Tax=Gymnopilus dilepis TaxID=231916 RepID=A0A409WXD7_9AGAR|nr:hypothetical protein CVT26_008491 [Gymnopilus dilepis]
MDTDNHVEQPRRPRGRPKKAKVESRATEEATVAKAVPRKRGRKNDMSASEDKLEQVKEHIKPEGKEDDPPRPPQA